MSTEGTAPDNNTEPVSPVVDTTDLVNSMGSLNLEENPPRSDRILEGAEKKLNDQGDIESHEAVIQILEQRISQMEDRGSVDTSKLDGLKADILQHEEAITGIKEAQENNKSEETKKAEEELYTTARRGAAVIDVSEIKEQVAKRVAEQKINERQNKKGFKGLLDKAYLRFFEDVEKYRELKKARTKINKEGLEDSDGEYAAIVERVTLDLMHEGEETKDVQDELTAQTRDLIKSFAKGELDEVQFEEKRQELVDSLASGHRDIFLKNEAKTDNIFEVAKQARVALKHGASLDILDENFQMTLARVRGGVRTEADMGKVDRMVEFMQKTPGLNLITPETVGMTLGVIYSLGTFGAQRAARSKMAAISTFGATAAFGLGFGMARRNKELKSDIAMHTREMASGFKIEAGSKRREKLDQFTTEMKSASDITEKINEILENPETGVVEASQLFDLIAEARARTEIGDQENLDLIAFSDVTRIEQERTELDIALARGRLRLEKVYPKDDERKLDDLLTVFTDKKKEDIHGEMAEKSAEFKKFRMKESLKSGAKGAVVGLVAGGVMMEAVGFASHLIEGHDIGKMTRTPLESLYDHFRGGPRMNPENWHDVAMGTHGAVKLPDGVNLLDNKNGTFSLYDSVDGKNITENITMNPDGSFTTESLDHLNQSGIRITDNVHQVVEDHSRQVTLTDQEAIHQRPEFKQVSRDMWYDNDTQMYMGADGNMYGADHNELGLWLGGTEGTGINANGDYVFDVSHMTADGSWHDGLSTDFQDDIKAGNLKLNMSMSEETQRFVASVKIDEHGQAIIPKDSELAKIFFENQNGQAVFKGRFAEVSEVIGQRDGHDVVRMLATAEGNGASNYISTIVDKISVDAHQYAFDIPRETEMGLPPIIPIFGRRPLEVITKNKENQEEETNENLYFGYYYNNYGNEPSAEQKLIMEKRINPNFSEENSPNFRESYSWYKEYLKNNKEENIGVAEYYASKMEPMSEKCKAVVCIPLAAEDYHNIYSTLENYLSQVDQENVSILDRFRILINVNSPISNENQNQNKEAINEIERFKEDHPELQVDYMSTQFRSEQFVHGGMQRIRKVMADTAIMLAGDREGVDDDIIIVSNDADMRGINTGYINEMTNVFDGDQERKIDAVQGALDWDVRDLAKSPIALIGTRIFQFHELYDSYKRGVNGASGANTALRGSVYCNIGGYLDESTLSNNEDQEMAALIREKRGWNTITRGSPRTLIYTDARRAFESVAEGSVPSQQWATFGAENQVRTSDYLDNLVKKFNFEYDFKRVDEVERFKKDVENIVNSYYLIRNRTEGNSAEMETINAVLGFGFGLVMGKDYELHGNKFELKNPQKLVSGIDSLRERVDSVFERKIGKRKSVEGQPRTEPQSLENNNNPAGNETPETPETPTPTGEGADDVAETTEVPPIALAQALDAAEIHEGATIQVAGEERVIKRIREGVDGNPTVLIVDPPIIEENGARKVDVDLRRILNRSEYRNNLTLKRYRIQEGFDYGRQRIRK